MAAAPPKSHLTKRVGKYLMGRTIGEGSYAKVKYGQHAESGEAVAVKVLDKERLVRSGMVEQIKREITILQQIRHPHIVNLELVMSSRDSIFMVLELVTGGELFDHVVAHGPMKEAQARRIFSQLLDAVAYCHARGVFHRDLKPENVLLTSAGAVKLSDFGLGAMPAADAGGGDALLRTTCGTPNYVAPEVLAQKGYRGGPADIWSLGVVLYVMLAGCLPFDEDDLPTLFHKIAAAEYAVPPWLSADAAALLAAMLQPDPEQRPTAEQLWQHPWLRSTPGSGLARRSAVRASTGLAARAADLIAGEAVEPEEIQEGGQARLAGQMSPGRKPTAFDLLKAGLDMSALFEARDDLVARHTRFSSRAPLATIAASIESAAVAVGGRVEHAREGRVRLRIPNPRGQDAPPLAVRIEIFQVLPGTHMVDVQKVTGSTAHFYSWYAEITAALASIIAQKQPGAAGELGSASAAARHRSRREAGGRLRKNAFELIASSFNVSALLEEEPGTARHAQFSSRRAAGEVLDAVQAAAVALGGVSRRHGDKRAVLTLPVGGLGRSMRLQAHLFEVLPGVHVCQLDKFEGSSLDFMRVYAQLASQPGLQAIMMKKSAFPTATHAGQLLDTSASMSEAERQAVQAVQALAPAGSSYDGSSRAQSGADVAAAAAAEQQQAAGGGEGGATCQPGKSALLAAGGSSTAGVSRRLLPAQDADGAPGGASPEQQQGGADAERRAGG